MAEPILTRTASALAAARAYLTQASAGVIAQLGEAKSAVLDTEQRRLHALAWTATTVEALEQLLGWARRAEDAGRFGEGEQLVLQIGYGEYLAQLVGGLPMSQNEFARPSDMGASAAAAKLADAAADLLQNGSTPAARSALAKLLGDGWRPYEGIGDETLDAVRDQFRRFTADKITPKAHGWHLKDQLIPDEIVQEMADAGVFGVCIAEEYGGLGQIGRAHV